MNEWFGYCVTSPLENRMHAVLYPEVSKSLGYSFFEGLKTMAGERANNLDHDCEEYVLEFPYREYKLSELLVSTDELIRIGVIKRNCYSFTKRTT